MKLTLPCPAAWISYAVAGAMQGVLLVMCIIFRARQHKHGLDDFGRPLAGASSDAEHEPSSPASQTPSPVETAVEDAVESDLRSEHGVDVVPAEREFAGEETPLLTKQRVDQRKEGGILSWFK